MHNTLKELFLSFDPTRKKNTESEDIKAKHESIRIILMNNGNIEYGDCIIDEICDVVGIPPTTIYYVEGQ